MNATTPARDVRALWHNAGVVDWSAVVFIISAGIGVLIAADGSAAWGKFVLIIFGALLYLVLSHVPEHARFASLGQVQLVSLALAILPALIAVYFMLMNDWTVQIGKIPFMDPIIGGLPALQADLAAVRLSPNAAGGAIATLMPLQLAGLRALAPRRVWWVTLVGISAAGLLLSLSRGAWLALIAVVLVGVMWVRSRVWARRIRLLGTIGILAVCVIGALVLGFTPLGERLLSLRSDRREVWRNSLDLASDYPLTGLGLGNIGMAYSSYVLLVHVPHTAHAHDLYLDVWLEQGLLGLMALGGLVIAAVWTGRSLSRYAIAALASIAVILLHGLVDDALYGYGARAAFVLFVPFAVLARQQTSRGGAALRPILICWVVVACVCVVSTLFPSVRAILDANRGALRQTQVELSVYRWPQWPLQDAVRRIQVTNLGPAIENYRMALVMDATNVTANRRLGQIELSLGQYDSACSRLSLAYTAAPYQRATRQLLAECYALYSDIDRAVELWRTLDMDAGQLDVRTWWYAVYLDDGTRAGNLAQAAQALTQP